MQFNWMFVIRNAPMGPGPAFTFEMLPWDLGLLSLLKCSLETWLLSPAPPWDLLSFWQCSLGTWLSLFKCVLIRHGERIGYLCHRCLTQLNLRVKNRKHMKWNDMIFIKHTGLFFNNVQCQNQTQAKPNKDSVLIRHAAPPTNKDFPASWRLWQVQCWVLWTISGSRVSGRRQPCFSEELPLSTRDSLRRPSSSKSAIALQC